MSTSFNYKHLHYFWVVAKEGGISRAAEKLDMAVQTVSAQVRELERSLGYALLKPAGRGLIERFEAREMLAFKHSGFSVNAGACIQAQDRAGLERLLCYRARPTFGCASGAPSWSSTAQHAPPGGE